jgi:hypothetical protein
MMYFAEQLKASATLVETSFIIRNKCRNRSKRGVVMLSKAVFKRVVPFLLSFVAGLFIASFFVSLAVPDFSGFRRGPNKMREYRKVKVENEELRRENCRLKKELEAARSEGNASFESLPPDINLAVPPPPLPVAKHKELKMKTVQVK